MCGPIGAVLVRQLLGTTVLVSLSSLVSLPDASAEESIANSLTPLENIGATVLGASTGGAGGLVAGTIFCPLLGGGGSTLVLDCFALKSPVPYMVGGIGAIFGGMLGYDNHPVFVMGGGVLVGAAIGAPFGILGGYLTAFGGGYLGYRIWDSRESDVARYSLLPFWDQEGSGVVLSGRF